MSRLHSNTDRVWLGLQKVGWDASNAQLRKAIGVVRAPYRSPKTGKMIYIEVPCEGSHIADIRRQWTYKRERELARHRKMIRLLQEGRPAAEVLVDVLSGSEQIQVVKRTTYSATARDEALLIQSGSLDDELEPELPPDPIYLRAMVHRIVARGYCRGCRQSRTLRFVYGGPNQDDFLVCCECARRIEEDRPR